MNTIIADSCLARYFVRILTEKELAQKKEAFFHECESSKVRLLWKILVETDIEEVDLLEERIYQYGSMLKEHDYFGRDIFLCMIALLHQLKNK